MLGAGKMARQLRALAALAEDPADYLLPGHQLSELTEVDNEGKLCTFCEKRIFAEVAADALGEEQKGSV
ncbi:40S ribosomal protein S6 [Microtus ochrogaster]|uniref:40S ribosomal protein S6 n=1 Tax=Microtus ochrogaster TaxID=79684 RepID=A0A8J6KQ60_MICOH|nr:40S ribosomal protein S6 [Microtus ochrogaster]